jgi:hypothetical protein
MGKPSTPALSELSPIMFISPDGARQGRLGSHLESDIKEQSSEIYLAEISVAQ